MIIKNIKNFFKIVPTKVIVTQQLLQKHLKIGYSEKNKDNFNSFDATQFKKNLSIRK